MSYEIKRNLAVILFLILSLMTSLFWGGYNYVERKICQQKQVYAEKVARKDNEKANVANTRLLNVARPDSVRINPTTGQTILYISNNKLSDQPISPPTPVAVAEPAVADTEYYSAQAERRIEKRYTAAVQKQSEAITYLQRERDSLLLVAYHYKDKNVTIEQRRKKTSDSTDIDSLQFSYNADLYTVQKNVPASFFGLKLGVKKVITETRSRDPRITFSGEDVYRNVVQKQESGASLSWTVNYNLRANILQTGPGLRVYYKDFNAYSAFYYSFYTHRVNPTFSLSRTLFRF